MFPSCQTFAFFFLFFFFFFCSHLFISFLSSSIAVIDVQECDSMENLETVFFFFSRKICTFLFYGRGENES